MGPERVFRPRHRWPSLPESLLPCLRSPLFLTASKTPASSRSPVLPKCTMALMGVGHVPRPQTSFHHFIPLKRFWLQEAMQAFSELRREHLRVTSGKRHYNSIKIVLLRTLPEGESHSEFVRNLIYRLSVRKWNCSRLTTVRSGDQAVGVGPGLSGLYPLRQAI